MHNNEEEEIKRSTLFDKFFLLTDTSTCVHYITLHSCIIAFAHDSFVCACQVAEKLSKRMQDVPIKQF